MQGKDGERESKMCGKERDTKRKRLEKLTQGNKTERGDGKGEER